MFPDPSVLGMSNSWQCPILIYSKKYTKYVRVRKGISQKLETIYSMKFYANSLWNYCK